VTLAIDEVSTKPWYQQVSREHWRTLGGCWLGWTLDGFDFLIITYVLTDIAAEFKISLATAGILILATFATRWLGGAFIGSLADKIGRKNALVLGIICYSVATFLCGISWNFTSMLIFRLFVGLGMAGEYAAGTTLLLESWPKHLRNKASGFLVSGWAAGGLAAAIAYPLIVPTYGWRSFFFLGILPAFLTLYIRRSVPDSQEWIDSRANAKSDRSLSFFQLFSRQWFPVAVTIFVMMFANFGMSWPVLSLMPTYLKGIGYDPHGVGQIMQIASVGALLGYWFSGFLGDWIGTRWAIVSVMAVSLIIVVLTFAFATAGLFTLGVLIFVLQFTNLGISGLLPLYIVEHFGIEVRAAGLGTTYNLGSIAGGLSPIWGASLAGTIGLGPAICALAFFWTVVCASIVGFEIPARVQRHYASPSAPKLSAVP
jgi:MFS transporter, SHS family, sialic acid transporter